MKLRINYRLHDEDLLMVRAASEVLGISVRQFSRTAPLMMARQIALEIIDGKQKQLDAEADDASEEPND